MRVVINATGDGWGHFARGLSLAMQLRARGIKCFTFVSTSFAFNPESLLFAASNNVVLRSCHDAGVALQSNRPEIEVVSFPFASFSGVKEFSNRLVMEMEKAAPDIFIADALPRGLTGENVFILGPAYKGNFKSWLIYENLNPEYEKAFDVQNFVDAHFDTVVFAQPFDFFRKPAGPKVVFADPIVPATSFSALHPDSNVSPGATVLQSDALEPKVVLVANGLREERAIFAQLARALLETKFASRLQILCSEPLERIPIQLQRNAFRELPPNHLDSGFNLI